MKTMKTRAFTDRFARALAVTAVIHTVTLTPASASPDYCEEEYQSVTQTGLLTRRTIKARAELDFSEARDGVIALSASSVKAEGIPHLPTTMKYTLNDFVVQLERDLDRELRVNHLYLSSHRGSATFVLVGGELIERLLDLQLDDEKLLDGLDPQRLTLSEALRLLGFGGEMRQAALKVLQAQCALSQDPSGTRLLQGIIRKFDKPAPHRAPHLGCPPCELEADPS